jgi:hypothetical protein
MSQRRRLSSAERDELELDVVRVPEHHRGVSQGLLFIPDAGEELVRGYVEFVLDAVPSAWSIGPPELLEILRLLCFMG